MYVYQFTLYTVNDESLEWLCGKFFKLLSTKMFENLIHQTLVTQNFVIYSITFYIIAYRSVYTTVLLFLLWIKVNPSYPLQINLGRVWSRKGAGVICWVYSKLLTCHVTIIVAYPAVTCTCILLCCIFGNIPNYLYR